MGIFLSLRQVSFNYHTPEGETRALKNVTFDVDGGEFVALVGPSGCGKTTLLSLIAGLLSPDEGDIIIKNPSLPIGYMLQKDELLPWRTTWGNVLLGPELMGKVGKEQRERAEELLRMYGLYEFRDTYPSGLSGGMRQRVALIRTLMRSPELLLLDEPFSALDYQTRLRVSDDIWKIIKEQKKTAILITHDIAEAISMADRVLILSNRPATIIREVSVCFPSLPARTPFATRSCEEFQNYFSEIWKEMSQYEEA